MRIELAAGLPPRVQLTLLGTAWMFDFSRAQRDLLPGTTVEMSYGSTIDPAWANLYLFGDSYYDGGGSPSFGIHRTTGEIWGLDVERNDETMYFLNSTARAFIDSLAAVDRALRLGELSPRQLQARLEAIDPAGYPRSDWRAFATFLVEESTP